MKCYLLYDIFEIFLFFIDQNCCSNAFFIYFSAIFGAVEHPGDFATYLLAIFIGNLMFYTIYYTIMKVMTALFYLS
jgi:hypothetical protein